MKDRIMEKVQSHYKAVEEADYEPLFTTLYGSQNYHIDTPESDVDTKTLVCPSFEDLIKSTKTTSSRDLSTGLAAIVDFREMFKQYYKGSINFVETLFTPYVVVNPEWLDVYHYLRSYRERIARMNPYGTICAAAGHARNAAKFSNTKSVANVMRLKDFIERFDRNEESYGKILVPSNLEEIREVRSGEWKDEYTALVTDYLRKINSVVYKYEKKGCRVDEQMVGILNEFSYKLMRKVMKKYA